MRDLSRRETLVQLAAYFFHAIPLHVEQQHHEFFAAVTSSNVQRTTRRLCDYASDARQTVIARLVAAVIVEELELIEIDQQQRDRHSRADGLIPQTFDVHVEHAPV